MRPRLLWMLGAAALVACSSGAAISPVNVPVPDPRAPMPGPGPLARPHAVAANEACASCHTEAAAAWRTSLHARAFVDPVFQRSFEKEPATFCRDCHAPETGALAMGIGCVTCHDPAGAGIVLAAPSEGATSARGPHAVVRDAAFATERACARCHDFAFPDAALRGHDGARMQRTSSEHGASAFAQISCAACHMPKTNGAVANGGVGKASRAHDFSVASAPAMLKRALVARATRRGDRAVLDLTPGEVGHAFPTGDLFRRLVVVAEVTGDDYQLLAHEERALARHFRFEPNEQGGKVQREISDDRIAGPRHLELDLGERASGHEIAWRIEWQRVESMTAEHAEVADIVIVAEGRLPVNRGEREAR